MPVRVLVRDDDVEGARERRKPLESKADGPVTLGGHDPELPPFGLQPRQDREQLVEGLERLVQPVVVLLVGLEQRIGVLDVDRLHLRDDSLAADGHPQLVGRNLATEHGADRVLHRREDDRPGVDQRAVEVEQDDPEAHTAIVAMLSTRPARGRGPTAAR